MIDTADAESAPRRTSGFSLPWLPRLRRLPILALALGAIIILRLPSLFEPFWYGDEGVFAAVARNITSGGTLYESAWDNKPPLVYFTYAAVFKLFGVSMFWLHLTATLVILGTAAAVYAVGAEVLGKVRGLLAALLFGFVTSLRLVEGDLALTETFMVLPITVGMLLAIRGKFDGPSLVAAGALLAIGSLFKQVGAFEAAALGLFLFLRSSALTSFIRQGLLLTAGFLLPHVLVLVYFVANGAVGDYIRSAYTYYRLYLGEGRDNPLLIDLLRFAAPLAALGYGVLKRRRNEELDARYLILMWMAASFLGVYFSGRDYPHYLLQATPAVSLVVASVRLPVKLAPARALFALVFFLPLILVTNHLFGDVIRHGPRDQVNYWRNFQAYAMGQRSQSAYNNHFDTNVNSLEALSDWLRANGASGHPVFLWGDYPWIYATARLENASKYVAAYHVFSVPDGRQQLLTGLNDHPPLYIVKGPGPIEDPVALAEFIAERYRLAAVVAEFEVWEWVATVAPN